MGDEEQKINRVKDRKCPSCQQNVLLYSFVGIYFPIENKALSISMSATKEIPVKGVQFGRSYTKELFGIYLSSQCKNCGLTSFWDFNKEELEYVLDSKTHAIIWNYSPELWRIAKNTITADTSSDVVNYVSETLEFVNSFYGPQNRANEEDANSSAGDKEE